MSPSSVAWTPVRSFGAAAVDRPLHLVIPSKANNEHRESFAAPRNLQFVHHYSETLIYTDEPLECCLDAGAQLWSGRSRPPPFILSFRAERITSIASHSQRRGICSLFISIPKH